MDALIFRSPRAPAEKAAGKSLETRVNERLTVLAEEYSYLQWPTVLTPKEHIVTFAALLFLALYLFSSCLVFIDAFHYGLQANLLTMTGAILYLIITWVFAIGMGHVFWAQWLIPKDERFSGVPLDAPVPDLVASIWANARRQAATNDLLLLRGGYFWRRTLDARALCALVPKVIEELRDGPDTKDDFAARSPDEQVAAVGQRVLFLTLSAQ
jgi:hypothetical protein